MTRSSMIGYELWPDTGLSVLRRVERPVPEPGPGEVLVRVHARSLNFTDLTRVRAFDLGAGTGPGHPPGPLGRGGLIPLSDNAGEVVAVGADVELLRVGDRVVSNHVQAWVDGPYLEEYVGSILGRGISGTLAQYVVFRAAACVVLPPEIPYEEAAALPCAGLTAFHALFCTPRPVHPGSNVLVLGTGSVSLLALQLATAAGARVMVTSSSADRLAELAAMGAVGGVNYATVQDWPAEVRGLTAGRGADHIVDVVGDLTTSLAALATGGTLSVVGELGAGQPSPGTGTSTLAGTVRMKLALVHGVLGG
jgi:NADPH:quinone reductase-like Zn-dependent oxidoreductase